MEILKGPQPQQKVVLKRTAVPAGPGVNRFIYTKPDGTVAGEVQFLAFGTDVSREIVKDLYQLITGIVL